MRNKLLRARDEAAHAVWSSGTIHVSLTDRRKMKIHDAYPDAPLSPIYASLRPLGVKDGKLLPEHFERIGYAMALMALYNGLFRAGTHTWTAGIPAAGEPIFDGIVNTFGPRRKARILKFKLKKEEDERGRRIAGLHDDYAGIVPTDPDTAITLVDDLMTNLATKFEAVNVIEQHGAQVGHLLLFLNRSTNGIAELRTRNINTLALWDYDGLLEFGLAHQYLDRQTYEAIAQYPQELQDYLKQQQAA